jgi:hypothetical protein
MGEDLRDNLASVQKHLANVREGLQDPKPGHFSEEGTGKDT